MNTHSPVTLSLYNLDFQAWAETQAEYLRAHKIEQLDFENLAEEIAALGKQQQQELENRLGILLGHLLKWQYQPQFRSKSWQATIREHRRQINRLISKNPSLKSYWPEAMAEGYLNALDLVDRETPLKLSELPEVCPFSVDEIFDAPIEFECN